MLPLLPSKSLTRAPGPYWVPVPSALVFPTSEAIAIEEDAVEGAADSELQVDAIGGAIIGKGAKAAVLVVLDRVGVGSEVRGEGGRMEGAVIVDDAKDGVGVENIAASQGAIDGVGPAVKVVAGSRRGDGTLDVEATGRVDVEVDDFGCGLAVIGGGSRGNGAVTVGLVGNLDLTGLPHRVERGNLRIVIDVTGNGVERRLGRGLARSPASLKT